MSDLVAFLRARLDEDERIAQAASPGPWSVRTAEDERADIYAPASAGLIAHGFDRSAVAVGEDGTGGMSAADAEYIVRWDPARVLAEIAAKRAILDLHELVTPHDDDDLAPWRESQPGLQLCRECDWKPFPCPTVRLLAQPYADHPDFDPTWRTEA